MTDWPGLPPHRPLVMGVLNVTPDSMSDGGKYLDPVAAIAHGQKLLADGADLLDIGGETTRPGAAATPPDIEQARILPVIATSEMKADLPGAQPRHGGHHE